MDIVLASDENYAVHLATLVVSICENNKNEDINIHILDGGIKKDTIDKITTLKKKYKTLKFYNYQVDDEIILKRIGLKNIGQDRSLTTYARIFIPEILDQTIDSALYLDVDGIVTDSLKPLFDLINDDYAIMGVKDICNKSYRLEVGLNEQDNYICAGVIMWNLKKCREEKLVDKFKKFILSHNGNVKAMDQGTINGVMKGNIMLLHPKYNVLTPFFFKDSSILADMGEWNEFYSDEEIKEAITHPVFVHFTPGFTTRPWVKNCKHPLKEEYIKYRKLTEFYDFELQKDNRKLYVKFLGVIFYNFSYTTYKKVFNILYKIFR